MIERYLKIPIRQFDYTYRFWRMFYRFEKLALIKRRIMAKGL